MSYRPGKVFVQFVNPELLGLYGCQLTDKKLLAVATKLARIGLMVGEDGLVLPRSYLLEVQIIDQLLDYLRAARAAGLIQISSDSPVGLEFLAKKRREYRTQIELFPGYSDDTSLSDLDSSLWTPRTRSSSGDITKEWVGHLKEGGIWQDVLAQGSRPYLNRPLTRIENAIEATPQLLDGRAFIFRYVRELLPLALEAQQRVLIEMMISRTYLLSYMIEYDASIMIDLPLGGFDCGLAKELDGGAVISVRRFLEFLALLGISPQIASSMSMTALLRLRREPMWKWLVERYFEDLINPGRPLTGAMMAARFTGLPRLRKTAFERWLRGSASFTVLSRATSPHSWS